MYISEFPIVTSMYSIQPYLITSGKIIYINGDFLKWGYPWIIHFNRIVHYKPSIFGYHHLWNPPNGEFPSPRLPGHSPIVATCSRHRPCHRFRKRIQLLRTVVSKKSPCRRMGQHSQLTLMYIVLIPFSSINYPLCDCWGFSWNPQEWFLAPMTLWHLTLEDGFFKNSTKKALSSNNGSPCESEWIPKLDGSVLPMPFWFQNAMPNCNALGWWLWHGMA